jgi:hypothetical protein
VTQDHDLELPLTASAREHANDAAQEPIQQTRQHDAQSEPISKHCRPGGIEFLYPTGPVGESWIHSGLRVRLAGVLFFDFPHGQSGHARNYAELHPITGFRVLAPSP